MSKTKPWKQNLLKVPPRIEAKVSEFTSDECVAACLVQISAEEILDGRFHHLQIRLEEGDLVHPKQVIPPAWIGRYSKYNRHGREIVRDDLPMTNKSWSIEAPNYGDWDKGSHDVEFVREVYQRDYYGPKLVPIRIQYEAEDVRAQAHVFRFSVEEVLDRQAEEFCEQLLFNLNLLQENTGNHDVFESDANIDEYMKTLYVNWEILPPGESEDSIVHILSHTKGDDPRVREEIVDRYNFLRSLGPSHFIAGTNEFRRYFGAQFAEDLVVFENVEYGNAIYVMFDDWQELSKKSRTELLSSGTSRFIRIPHTKTWKLRLARFIEKEMRALKGGI